MKKNLKLFCMSLLILFILILLLVITNNTKRFDMAIYNFIISFRCNLFDNYFKFLTVFGNSNVVIVVLGLMLLFFRNKKGLVLTISTFSSVAINSIIKHIIRRKRPSVLRLIKQGGFSFPSGHAMISVCLYGYLLYLVNKNIKNKFLRIFLTIFFLIFILSIGISRIYVGVHFASDVIAGYLLSIFILIIVIHYTNKYLKGE